MKTYRRVSSLALGRNHNDLGSAGQKKEVLERAAEESKGTERLETAAELAGINVSAWTPDEQKLLEQVRSHVAIKHVDMVITNVDLVMTDVVLGRCLF
jgi:hypothetical protein